MGSDQSMIDGTGAAAWHRAVARQSGGAEAMQTLTARSRDGIALGPLFPKREGPVSGAWRSVEQPVAVIQRVDHPDPDEAGRMAAIDISHGATGLSLIFAGAGTARSFGLAIDDVAGLGRLLGAVGASTTAVRCELPSNSDERVLRNAIDQIIREADRTGLSIDLARDPVGEAARSGTLPFEAGEHSVLGTEAAKRWLLLLAETGISPPFLQADGRPHHEAGASEAQELAAILSTGVLYLRALQAGVATPSDAIRFTLVADADQTLTIVKFRALRRLWARVQQVCAIPVEPIALHGETSWRMLTRMDPWSNVLRNTVACAGAILGGADSVTVLPFTSASGLPDAFARRLARNTPLVLMQESALDRVADPCAGSGAFETLTDALCQEAWGVFQDLEAAGGLAATLMSGRWQARIAEAREARLFDLATGRTPIVGVTRFVQPLEGAPDVLMPPLSTLLETATSPRRHRFAALPSVRDAEAFEHAAAALDPTDVRKETA